MQSNFILTDVMKTGFHTDLEDFIEMHRLQDQQFHMTGEYYTLHNYNLDSYDRRFAIIDTRNGNDRIKNNEEFNAELSRRCQLLKSQGFVFIKSTPWESINNIEECEKKDRMFPKIDIEHIKWSGGVV